MIDYESTRPAFEAKYNTPCERRENGEYVEPIQQTGWEHWCRALEYAAQQPAPAPLPRPDKPGWWWNWQDGIEKAVRVSQVKDGLRATELWDSGTVIEYAPTGIASLGQWLPATPPPVPTAEMIHCEQEAARGTHEKGSK